MYGNSCDPTLKINFYFDSKVTLFPEYFTTFRKFKGKDTYQSYQMPLPYTYYVVLENGCETTRVVLG